MSQPGEEDFILNPFYEPSLGPDNIEPDMVCQYPNVWSLLTPQADSPGLLMALVRSSSTTLL